MDDSEEKSTSKTAWGAIRVTQGSLTPETVFHGIDYRINGRLPDGYNNNRAETHAIVHALAHTPLDQPLVIVSDSKASINKVWTELEQPLRSAKGYENALARTAACLLPERTATTVVQWTKAHEENKATQKWKITALLNSEADTTAKRGRNLPSVNTKKPGWHWVHGGKQHAPKEFKRIRKINAIENVRLKLNSKYDGKTDGYYNHIQQAKNLPQTLAR